MLSLNLQDIKLLQNPGVLDVLLLVFLEFLEEVLTELDKLLSETCAEEEECFPPLKSGEDGTENLT
jgi:hypothetical protein